MTLTVLEGLVLLTCKIGESSSQSCATPLLLNVKESRWPSNCGVYQVLFVPAKLMENVPMKLVGWFVQFKRR